jgi:hypothetical protein
MTESQHFAPGHYAVEQSAVHWEIDRDNATLEKVVLTVSLKERSDLPMALGRWGKTDTTLTFRMDARTAMQLHAALTQIGRDKGWLTDGKG